MSNNAIVALSQCVFSFIQEYDLKDKIRMILCISQLCKVSRQNVKMLSNNRTILDFSRKYIPLHIMYVTPIYLSKSNIYMNSIFLNIIENPGNNKYDDPCVLYSVIINGNYKIENTDDFFEKGICIYAALNRNIDMLKHYYSLIEFNGIPGKKIVNNIISSIFVSFSTNGFIKNDKILAEKTFDIVYSKKIQNFLWLIFNDSIFSYNIIDYISTVSINFYNSLVDKCCLKLLSFLVYDSRKINNKKTSYYLRSTKYTRLYLAMFKYDPENIISLNNIIRDISSVDKKYYDKYEKVIHIVVNSLKNNREYRMNSFYFFLLTQNINIYNNIFVKIFDISDTQTVLESIIISHIDENYNHPKGWRNIIHEFMKTYIKPITNNHLISTIYEIYMQSTYNGESSDDNFESDDIDAYIEDNINSKSNWEIWKQSKSIILNIGRSNANKIFLAVKYLKKYFPVDFFVYSKLLVELSEYKIHNFSSKNLCFLILSKIGSARVINMFTVNIMNNTIAVPEITLNDYPSKRINAAIIMEIAKPHLTSTTSSYLREEIYSKYSNGAILDILKNIILFQENRFEMSNILISHFSKIKGVEEIAISLKKKLCNYIMNETYNN